MRFILCSVVVVFFLHTTKSAGLDYYWKDYNGEVPTDAFQAGTDKDGNPIYIGQGFFLNVGLLPGTLHANSAYIKVTAQTNVFITDKNVKILCTEKPHKLGWKAIKYTDIPSLTNVTLVVGGQETNTDVYIGRALHEGSTEIGKVYNVAPFQGLALPNVQDSETKYESFEILTSSLDYELRESDIRFLFNEVFDTSP